MRKRYSYVFILAGIFLLLSSITYLIHYTIFGDAHHIFIYLIGDLAFLPLEVFIVVVLIERILTYREKRTKLQKMNMVIGAFFSEVGNYLLENLLSQFRNRDDISQNLNVNEKWTTNNYKRATSYAYRLPIDISYDDLRLATLKDFLSDKRNFILTLLENPSLLEHDRFTDLLWAVTHLDEELRARSTLSNLPEKDLEHIGGDIRRMYDHLASEWLDYVEHLKTNYPFLFSLILRTHPFQENPSPIIS